MRRALAPLAKVAEQTGAAVVVVRHLTKQQTGSAITTGGGSIGIIGAARSGLLIACDPDKADRRVLAVVKSNLAKRADSLSLRLEDAGHRWARVRWEGTSTHSADALIAATSDLHEKSALGEAKEMLADWLRDGPVATDPVCGGTLWRRRSGMVRCRVCIPDSSRDPYVSPVLEGQAA